LNSPNMFTLDLTVCEVRACAYGVCVVWLGLCSRANRQPHRRGFADSPQLHKALEVLGEHVADANTEHGLRRCQNLWRSASRRNHTNGIPVNIEPTMSMLNGNRSTILPKPSEVTPVRLGIDDLSHEIVSSGDRSQPTNLDSREPNKTRQSLSQGPVMSSARLVVSAVKNCLVAP